jgi:hypothetical protein
MCNKRGVMFFPIDALGHAEYSHRRCGGINWPVEAVEAALHGWVPNHALLFIAFTPWVILQIEEKLNWRRCQKQITNSISVRKIVRTSNSINWTVMRVVYCCADEVPSVYSSRAAKHTRESHIKLDAYRQHTLRCMVKTCWPVPAAHSTRRGQSIEPRAHSRRPTALFIQMRLCGAFGIIYTVLLLLSRSACTKNMLE